MTVAERGTLRMSAISPTCSPCPRCVSDLVAARHADLAVEDDEELVALVALADDDVAVLVLAHLDRLHHAQELALGEAREQRHVREDLALEGEAARAVGVGRALFADLHDERRDVVLAAAVVGERDERLDALVALERERLAQLLGRLEVAVEAVAREDERVAGDELDDQRVDLDPLVDADGARDGVLLLDLLDLLARQLPALDELVVDGVVLGDLLHLAAARQVDAAVAHVRDEALVAHDEERAQRRPHAALGGVDARLLVDLRAGALHRVLEQGDDVLRRDLARAGGAGGVVVEQLLLALDLLVHRADGDGARDLARGVAAHAVGDDEERELLVDEEVVLVVVADLADIGGGVEADGRRSAACRDP